MLDRAWLEVFALPVHHVRTWLDMFALPVNHVRQSMTWGVCLFIMLEHDLRCLLCLFIMLDHSLICLLCLFFMLDEAWPEVFALPILHARQSKTWGICLCAWLLPACLLPCLSGSATAENSKPSNVCTTHHPNQNKQFNGVQKEKLSFFKLSDKDVSAKTNIVSSYRKSSFTQHFWDPELDPRSLKMFQVG